MKDEEGCWGLCQYYIDSKQFVITLTTTFESKSQYMNILIHEMVHMTQYLTDNSMNHSKESFMSWREKLRHYGFELKKEY